MVTDSIVESIGKKVILMKTAGHERSGWVCLVAKGDGIKMKSLIDFAAAKRESEALHEEFKRHCSIASSGNGWINEELTWRRIN